MRALLNSIHYICRYLRAKSDAFQAFGSAGRSGTGLLPHSVVTPVATYSPWIADESFLRVYGRVRKATLVDKYRCYELWSLAKEAAKLPDGDFVEIGVWRGGTGCIIAAQASISAPGDTVYLCDTFTGVVKAGDSDRHYQGGEHADTSEQAVLSLTQEIGLENVRILAGVFPDQTGHAIESHRFRFCHIDVDVYQSGLNILNWVWPRMVPGGIVVFDDYGYLSTGGITKLVNEQRAMGDRIMLHNLNGHAVFVKISSAPTIRNQVEVLSHAVSERTPA